MAASCSPASSPIPAATPAAGTRAPALSAARTTPILRTAAPALAAATIPPAPSAARAAAIPRTPAPRAAAAAAAADAAAVPARSAAPLLEARAAAPEIPAAATAAAVVAAAAAITPRPDNRRLRAPYMPPSESGPAGASGWLCLAKRFGAWYTWCNSFWRWTYEIIFLQALYALEGRSVF